MNRVWREITDVDIASYRHPPLFRLLGIPHPERAEVIASGVGGQRIAHFSTGKRFIQRITAWNPPHEYAFSFNPERGFRVGFIFDLSDGPVQIPTGSYELAEWSAGTRIRLSTTYSIDRRLHLLLEMPVRAMLRAFQRYLLSSISRNVSDDRA